MPWILPTFVCSGAMDNKINKVLSVSKMAVINISEFYEEKS
jgi:hypothetical protein